MVIDLSTGNTIRIGNSVTLTVLAIEKDQVRFGIESSERDGNTPSFLAEESVE
jgi:sRNA-binding carbon storage regulator CsrA